MPTNPTEQSDAVIEARSCVIEGCLCFQCRIFKTLADEVGELRKLVVHMYVHSAYHDNGYKQMTTPQKALYDAVWERSVKELDEEENEPA